MIHGSNREAAEKAHLSLKEAAIFEVFGPRALPPHTSQGDDSFSYVAQKILQLGAVETGHRFAVDNGNGRGHKTEFFKFG